MIGIIAVDQILLTIIVNTVYVIIIIIMHCTTMYPDSEDDVIDSHTQNSMNVLMLLTFVSVSLKLSTA